RFARLLRHYRQAGVAGATIVYYTCTFFIRHPEVRAKRASKDDRPLIWDISVALRGSAHSRRAPQGEGDRLSTQQPDYFVFIAPMAPARAATSPSRASSSARSFMA